MAKWIVGTAAALGMLGGAQTAAAQYYIGPSYIQMPGVTGGAKQADHRNWVRAEAHYWTKAPKLREIRGITGAISSLQFTGSRAPANGPDMLALSIDKSNPALAAMMDKCRSGALIPQIVFSESSDLMRHPQEHGPRPTGVPDFYRYRLKNVHLTCPVAAGAAEQAFEVHFEQIEWLNARRQPKPVAVTAPPAALPPAPRSGTSKAFVISWFEPIADSRPDQCSRLNAKPSQDDYYAQMSPERAAEQ
jgi:type VI protein secretion system component Hcp